MLSYRWLEPSADNSADSHYLDQIRATLRELGWIPLPDVRYYGAAFKVMAAFDGARLIGFHVIQFFTHAEPLYVHPAYRGTPVPMQLTEKTVDYLVTSNTRGFMIVAENPVVARMAEHYGLKKVEHPVYVFTD